jgi:hypothetical protein
MLIKRSIELEKFLRGLREKYPYMDETLGRTGLERN